MRYKQADLDDSAAHWQSVGMTLFVHFGIVAIRGRIKHPA